MPNIQEWEKNRCPKWSTIRKAVRVAVRKGQREGNGFPANAHKLAPDSGIMHWAYARHFRLPE